MLNASLGRAAIFSSALLLPIITDYCLTEFLLHFSPRRRQSAASALLCWTVPRPHGAGTVRLSSPPETYLPAPKMDSSPEPVSPSGRAGKISLISELAFPARDSVQRKADDGKS